MKISELIFPEKIESDKVQLRKLITEDSKSIFRIYSHKESAIYDDWIPMKSITEAEKLILKAIKSYDSKTELRYGIIDQESEELIGSCGIFSFDEWNRKCMFYYQVRHDKRNRGFASEAIRLMTKYSFDELGVNRIEAYITPGNDPSLRVLEKNGFHREGLLREMEFYKNKFWNGIVMGMLKSDYVELSK